MRRIQREIEESAAVLKEQSAGGVDILTEAVSTGLIAGDVLIEATNDSILEQLRVVSEWKPQQNIGTEGSPIYLQQERIRNLRDRYRLKKGEIQEAENYVRQSDGFSSEASEQSDRLSAVKILKKETLEADKCPLCESKLEIPTPHADALNAALIRLQASIGSVNRERPRIQEYSDKLRNELESIRLEIQSADRSLEVQIKAIESREVIHNAQVQAAFVSGKASLYLDGVKKVSPESVLQGRLRHQELVVKGLEDRLDSERVEDLMDSILNVIGANMTIRAEELKLEHSVDSYYRLDIKNLSVVADSPEYPVPMERMGSGENHLGCHLITLLSLHEYFIKKNRPVPRFLILDQPSQVYFPSKDVYESLDGKPRELKSIGADTIAVNRLFELLFKTIEKLNFQLQIIVIEHANLEDERFQDALVEEPWTDGKALIPIEWFDNDAASSEDSDSTVNQ